MSIDTAPTKRHMLLVNLFQAAQRFFWHPLAAFLAASVALGSLATWLLARSGTSPILLALLALPIGYIPALLAVLVLHRSGSSEDWRAFRQRLTRWRVGLRWYAVALVTLPLVHQAGVALASQSGGQFPFHLERFALLPLFLIANLGEEIGWRGYALPQLQQRFHSLTASLILGVVWAAFHWVAFLQNPTLSWGFLVVGSLMLLAMSIVMTWVFNHSRQSVIVATAAHAMYDVVSIGVVPLGETTTPLLAFALGAGLMCVIALLLVVVQGMDLGRRR
jgi:membrane protease YdiL (CAAX protease family)